MESKTVVVSSVDFKKKIQEKNFYIDKTLMIKDLIEERELVYVFTRPRRFGKTLNQEMLRSFFDIQENNRQLFDGLSIGNYPEILDQHCNQYPVIFLSFNEVEEFSFEEFKTSVKIMMSRVYKEFNYLRESLDLEEKEFFEGVVKKTLEWGEYKSTLRMLCDFLSKYHQKEVIILIDEYDVPINKGFYKGYFEDVVGFFRGFFVSALKNKNSGLKMAVLTGCLRVSKESLFTGVNNLEVYTVLKERYSEYFGFTPEEVAHALELFDLQDRLTDVKEWYDGYRFGNQDIYNPWSVSKFLKEKNKKFVTHWAGTANNEEALREIVLKSETEDFRKNFELLVKGETIEKVLFEDITYQQFYKRPNMLYSFLVSAGYLKAKATDKMEDDQTLYHLEMPNREVKNIFTSLVKNLLNDFLDLSHLNYFVEATIKGNVKYFEAVLNEALQGASFHDTKITYQENSYHMYLLGLLFSRSDQYVTLSNRESGQGRYDICIKEKNGNRAAIFELKRAFYDSDTLEELCEDALNQAIIKEYEADLKLEKYSDIKIYGIGFKGKKCKVVLKDKTSE